MRPHITATILHLSDLHLGKDFADEGSTWKSSGLSLRSFLNIIVNRGAVMQCHDSYIFTGLDKEVSLAAQAVGSPGNEFDFYVATGDISTDVKPASRFDFASRYLTDRVPVNAHHTSGLSLRDKQLFCVPGNHDKMKARDLYNYLGAFHSLPQRPPYVVDTRARGGQRFIFFGIDSNLYKKKTLAAGLIDPATFGWLGDNIHRYAQEDAVRVLLLHHHPVDLNQFAHRSRWASFKVSVEGRYTTLAEGDRILALCRDGIDLIMHGHEHFPIAFRDPESGCVVVSAGTTSEFQPDPGHKNSFHALRFFGRKLDITRFDWDSKAHFQPSRLWQGDLDARGTDLEEFHF